MVPIPRRRELLDHLLLKGCAVILMLDWDHPPIGEGNAAPVLCRTQMTVPASADVPQDIVREKEVDTSGSASHRGWVAAEFEDVERTVGHLTAPCRSGR